MYDTSCAPFLALRTIQQLPVDEEENFPTVVKAAREHMYAHYFLGESDAVDSVQESS